MRWRKVCYVLMQETSCPQVGARWKEAEERGVEREGKGLLKEWTSVGPELV